MGLRDVLAENQRDYESDVGDQGYETETEQASSTSQSETREFHYTSSSLPFGQYVDLASVDGPTYLTAQTLVEQVAFTLSDKIFTYSPETFDLDLSLKYWQGAHETNGFGHATGVFSQETRSGAGSIALGYMFSKDFDLSKRHIPQTIVASSSSLHQMQPALDQLSLLYSVSNPVVAHVAAVAYSATAPGFVTDYVTSMVQAEELGLGLVASTSTYEAQHMALFATLLSKFLPSIHTYDGINVGRETTRVVDALAKSGLHNAYENIAMDLVDLKHLDHEGKTVKLLSAFNGELGTDYKFFEYYGHAEPETVLVVFGSVEGSLAAQLAFALGKTGAKVGAINVRLYRPFVEESFLAALPKSVKNVAVLGQVKDDLAVREASEHSCLFNDILAAVTFSTTFTQTPVVHDIKYSREEVWTPSKMLAILQQSSTITGDVKIEIAPSAERPNLDVLGPSVEQYTFWDVDDSVSINAPIIISQVLAKDLPGNVAVHTSHDNLVQGGLVRVDIRCSAKSIDAPYSSTSSNVVFVGDEKLLANFDIPSSLRERGTVLIRLPGSKGAEVEKIEKRLPASFRQKMVQKQAQLYILDPSASSQLTDAPEFESLLTQLAVLQFTSTEGSINKLARLSQLAKSNGNPQLLHVLQAESDLALWKQDLPESWATIESEQAVLPSDLNINSFVAFDKEEHEQPTFLKTWITAAKGMAFKEATGHATSLRPDMGVKTMTVTVQERKRLTPASYDRNIFHIEFDLGNSGLTYAIGEALGIHAENDKLEVEEFIKWYGLNADDVVEVPSREDPHMLENRTVYQSLLQNIDIFGRPPKRFYEALAEFASDENEKKELLTLAGPEGANEFKRRAEVDTITYADILLDFPSAHPSFHEVVRIVSPMKRREYSIASSQKVTPNSVSLLIVTVGWVDPKGRDRFGQATRYLNGLVPGAPVTVSVKPSVMKLPSKSTAPLIMAGLGTGLAPFRAFVQERAWQKQQGMEIGSVLLYMGSRHQREEYLYGEEWEAYQDAGIITLLGRAFSRDQPQKIYIQDRMRQTLEDIRKAYLHEEGSFYLCGPTWPVPDVTEVLQEAIEVDAKGSGKKIDSRKEIEKLKDEARYVLEVY